MVQILPVLYCHHFGVMSHDIIGHVMIRSAVGGFL